MQATNKEVSIGTQVFYQVLLMGTSLVVSTQCYGLSRWLYPSQADGPWPIPNVISFDNWDVIQTTDSKGNCFWTAVVQLLSFGHHICY